MIQLGHQTGRKYVWKRALTKKLKWTHAVDIPQSFPHSSPVCPQQCPREPKGRKSTHVTGGSHLCACGSHSPTSTWTRAQRRASYECTFSSCVLTIHIVCTVNMHIITSNSCGHNDKKCKPRQNKN